MMNRKQLGVLLLSVGLVIMLAASSALIIHEADHDCTGEDCPVCQAIAVGRGLLRALGMAMLLLWVFFILRQNHHVRPFSRQYSRFFPHTLVSLKIRLND